MFTHKVETSTPAILARDATVTLFRLIALAKIRGRYKVGSSSAGLGHRERALKIIETVERTLRPGMPYEVSSSVLPLIRTRLNITTSGRRCETVLQAR